ncbi:hypothetical protein F5X96DRAFT_620961 [Biscogniauxia mediterranea]|nr:hypothetical protein F5X96DRAFT_620961 [Biscogniauxia mediterranea]
MAAVLPPYVAGDSPPSYEEVAGKVDRLVGGSTDPQKYLDVASSLSEMERKVLQDGAEENNPIKTDKDKEKLTLGAVKTMSTDEAIGKLKDDAKTAAEAVKAIDASFATLQQEIAKIDQIESTEFLNKLNEHKKKYRAILQKSRLLAADISQYGSSFDKVIIPLVTDESLTVDQRKDQINKFIERTEGFQTAGNDINEQFESLNYEFGHFIAEFSIWGKDKEQELNDEIKKLYEKLADLADQLAKLQTTLLALGFGLGAGLTIGGIALALSGPAAPFILIGGLIFFGATAAAVAGIAIAMGVISNQIDETRREIKEKSDEIDTIKHARKNLEDVGKTQFGVFRDSIQVLESYWTAMLADAEKAKGWLEDGANMANIPQYMEHSLKEGVQVYSAMAKYLDEYAKGTQL